jgi:hypothetical protein
MADESSQHSVSLQRGDPVPHFVVATLDQRTVEYSTLWQRRNLVLVTLGEVCASARTYVSQLADAGAALQSHETECVITRDYIPGVASPNVMIADRWGEIAYVAGGSNVADLPPVPEILEWVAYLQIRCPECEGEAR